MSWTVTAWLTRHTDRLCHNKCRAARRCTDKNLDRGDGGYTPMHRVQAESSCQTTCILGLKVLPVKAVLVQCISSWNPSISIEKIAQQRHSTHNPPCNFSCPSNEAHKIVGAYHHHHHTLLIRPQGSMKNKSKQRKRKKDRKKRQNSTYTRLLCTSQL